MVGPHAPNFTISPLHRFNIAGETLLNVEDRFGLDVCGTFSEGLSRHADACEVLAMPQAPRTLLSPADTPTLRTLSEKAVPDGLCRHTCNT